MTKLLIKCGTKKYATPQVCHIIILNAGLIAPHSWIFQNN